MLHRLSLFVVLCAIPLAASPTIAAPPAETADDPLLAVSTAGEVHQSDVEREIRFLRPSERRWRQHMGLSATKNWHDWIHRLALRQIGHQVAQSEGLLNEPRVAETARKAGRDWLLAEWEEDCYGQGFDLPSDAELAQELAGQEIHLPERRRLSHIFLRTHSEAEAEAARKQLAAWRQQIGSLEQFHQIARRHSDSQTARDGGSLGLVRRGWLPEEAEEVLYELPEGAMSPPLALRGGVHLFWVEEVLPATVLPLDRKIARLRGERKAAARQACRDHALAAARQKFPVRGEAEGEVVAVGERQLPADVVEELYPPLPDARPAGDSPLPEDEGKEASQGTETAGGPAGDVAPAAAPTSPRRRWIEDELLYQAILASPWPDAGMRRRLADLEDDTLLNELLLRRLDPQQLAPSEEELRAAYAATAQGLRKARSLDLKLIRTQVAEGTDPLAFYDRLTALADGLRAGERTWAEATAAIPGDGVALDPPLTDALPLANLVGPVVFELVKDLPVGSVAGPIQDQAEFFVVVVEGDDPARRLTFEEARPRLARRLQRDARQERVAQITAQLLAEHAMRLTAAGAQRAGVTPAEEPTETSE